MQNNTTYQAEFYLWSAIGANNRCTQLLHEFHSVTGLEAAYAKLQELAADHPEAAKGHYHIPEYPNQNLRSDWVTGKRLRPA